MAIPVAAAPLIILTRRRIGAIAVVLGVIIVAIGFVMPLGGLPDGTTPAAQSTQIATPVATFSIPSAKSTIALIASNSQSGTTVLRHLLDHPLLSSGALGSVIVDAAMRGGIVLILVAAGLAIAFNVMPMMRGLVGVAAGVGLLGVGIEMGVIFGEGMRANALCTATACHVDPHAGVWLMAIGFLVAMVGGAVGAMRPLAGLIGGVSFAATGVVLGAGVAFLVAQEHVLDLAATVGQAAH